MNRWWKVFRGKRRPPTSEGSEWDSGSSKLDQRQVRKHTKGRITTFSWLWCCLLLMPKEELGSCGTGTWPIYDGFYICTFELYHARVLCGFLQRENFVSSSLLESVLIRCVCSLSASAAEKLKQRKTSPWGKKISLSKWLPVAEVYVSEVVASSAWRNFIPVYCCSHKIALKV